MTTEVSEKLYTIPEFLALDLPSDVEYELIGGKVVARPRGSTSGRHGRIVGRLSQWLNNYLDIGSVGVVYTEASCTLGVSEGLNYPKPDVCFVATGRSPEDFDGPIPVAPDLVIEVWSPSDTDEGRLEKIKAYQAAGVRLIWSIHMLDKYIMVYRYDQPRSFLDLKDDLDGEDVLPGFKLPVSKLFE